MHGRQGGGGRWQLRRGRKKSIGIVNVNVGGGSRADERASGAFRVEACDVGGSHALERASWAFGVEVIVAVGVCRIAGLLVRALVLVIKVVLPIIVYAADETAAVGTLGLARAVKGAGAVTDRHAGRARQGVLAIGGIHRSSRAHLGRSAARLGTRPARRLDVVVVQPASLLVAHTTAEGHDRSAAIVFGRVRRLGPPA